MTPPLVLRPPPPPPPQSQTPYSIGYMDAANGLDLGLLEVAVLNKDGKYVTSQVRGRGLACGSARSLVLQSELMQGSQTAYAQISQAQTQPSVFLNLQTGDVSGAALALFKSDAWPSSPVKSFASVSVLNQPGAKTFPIVAMWVRSQAAYWLTSRGMGGRRAS